ncbi:MAG: TOBE domain-containing protein, partial [Undibacterium sp.]|nr:TOBE domain-containing protein [Undibacterium sp.]
QVEAMTLGQRIAVFNAGRIEQVGAPLELYDNPGNLFVAGFLGAPKMNLLKAQVIALAQNSVTVQIADGSTLALAVSAQGLSVGDQVTLGCRAEHVLMRGEDTSADNVLNVSVNFVEHLGDASIVYANLPNATDVIALKLATDTATIKPGCAIKLQFPASSCHLFDAAGKACIRY